MTIRRKTLAATASVLALCVGVTALAPAVALAAPESAEAAQDYQIAAQPLRAALIEFSRQSRSPVVASTALVRGLSAPAVEGRMNEAQALDALLAGTGLVASLAVDGGWSISRRAAADPQGGSAGGDVDALIVTAQKREENIQDVPIAISAFSQEDLTRSQVAGGPDLITQVPNMTFTKTNFSSYSIQIRGIGTQAISATTDAAVAVAFNNTPFIRNRFFEQEFYDLQRVEVLRGPQGTLYGRNATAGVVNIISAKPKFVYEAKLSGDVANYNSTRVEGMVNIPLVEDAVALRLAGAWTKREGFATNELTGNPIDGRNLWSTRVSLRVSPSDRLDMNLIWEHFEEEDDRLRSGKQLCTKDIVTQVGDTQVQSFDQRLRSSNLQADWIRVQPRFSTGCERGSLYSPDAFQTVNGASVPYYVPLHGIGLLTTYLDPYVSPDQSRDLRVIESVVDPKYRAKAEIGEFQLSYGLTDDLTLSSETAYGTDFVWSTQDFNRFNTAHGAWATTTPPNGTAPAILLAGILSSDGVFCDPQIGCTDRLVAQDLATSNSTTFSQEFRLGSDFDGPFNFSLGANFLRFDVEDKYYVFINSLTLTAAEQPTGSFIEAGSPPRVNNDWVRNVSDNRQCLPDGLTIGDLSLADDGAFGYDCIYIDPNPIETLNDQGHNYFLSKNPYKLISYAAFGEAYYNITDNLKITAGLRWTVDKKDAPRIPTWTFAGLSRGYPVLEVVKQEWREPTGRLAIDWKPDLSFTDQTLVYASYARGYKAGGSNPPPLVPVAVSSKTFGGSSATRPKTFEPEFVDAFELGAKNTLADGKVTLNLAGFYYDYTGYQISEIVDRSAFNHNYDAIIYGLEIEADWRPFENLKLGFKGGYEHARFKDGEQAIDLMDRTAGNPDWITIRPFPTFPSSCIVPVALFTHNGFLGPLDDPHRYEVIDPNYTEIDDLGGGGGSASGGCEYAYLAGNDPVTNLPYVANPTTDAGIDPDTGDTIGGNSSWTFWSGAIGTPGAYPGFNPKWAPNNGEGFYKNIGGNPLPNAPDFTATITADYTLPLPNDWLATFHTDLYWQSDSNWRIFDDHEYNKLDPYFTMNLAAIFANEEHGWRVMAYVKNVFDRDSITGAFLNSDDTGLTTNVFLTEPRLYGIRVTKAWDGGPLLGSFGERHDGPYPFEIELGGQNQRQDAPNEALAPEFLDQFSSAIDPLPDQQDDLDWGDGREVKVTWRPNETWKVALEARFGRTNGSMPWSTRSEDGDAFCISDPATCVDRPLFIVTRHNYSISDTYDREDHTVVDFTVGRDFGIGGLTESSVSGGVRYADLGSTTRAHIFGTPNWNFQNESAKYTYEVEYYGNTYTFTLPTPGGGSNTHDAYDQTITAGREFKGAGPVVSWDASQALLGDSGVGVFALDWSITGGVLFGKRKTEIHIGELTDKLYTLSTFEGMVAPDTTITPAYDISRSESVSVPTAALSLGLSYSVDRFKLRTGYRWERYFDAIDGGFMESKEEDRTIDGPYLKVSVGFGG